jgi:uncharacterized protein (TIGR02118 family)
VIKYSVLYPEAPKNPEAFDQHYLGVHIPIAEKLPGLVRCEVTKYSGLADGSPAPSYLQTDLVFESPDAAAAAFKSDVGKQLAEDRANFPDTPSVVAVGSILR